jgi:type IV pilus assembly protein PilB
MTAKTILGRALVGDGVVDEATVEAAEESSSSLPVHLVTSGALSEDTLITWQAKKFRIQVLPPEVPVTEANIAHGVLPEAKMREYGVLPLRIEDGRTVLAITDATTAAKAVQEGQFRLGQSIRPFLASPLLLDGILRKLSSTPEMDLEVTDIVVESSLEDIASGADDEPVVKLAADLLMEALRRGASDIHLEPFESYMLVRMRIDGVLHTMMRIPLKHRNGLVSRVKILSKLDITERRVPQDGRLRVRYRDESVDFRVSTMPTVHGETVVLRALHASAALDSLDALGLFSEQAKTLREALGRPYGLILATGPTGSGKTTTLYTCLGDLNDGARNICTAEDPVEFLIEGVNQVAVSDAVGLTFAVALRAFLRQDPDVLLVGEIRDAETADIALKAAQTGHLVLSTLHTNDSITAIPRLHHMGVPLYQIESGLILVAAQRTMRKLCQKCRTRAAVSESALRDAGWRGPVPEEVFLANKTGCPYCNGGYSGRIGVYEILSVDSEDMRGAISGGASASRLRKIAQDEGMLTLRENALRRVCEGVTSLDEALRVT